MRQINKTSVIVQSDANLKDLPSNAAEEHEKALIAQREQLVSNENLNTERQKTPM